MEKRERKNVTWSDSDWGRGSDTVDEITNEELQDLEAHAVKSLIGGE